MINIAVDGPGGAGKSTISRRIASRLGYLYIDTGAMYRAVGLAAWKAGLALEDAQGIAALAEGITVSLEPHEGGTQVLLCGKDVAGEIRTEIISQYASAVSAVPEVRALLLESQRELARTHNVIMDGRDIGTVVLPDAQIKIFLTATPEERARRRYEELIARGEPADYDAVLSDINLRDQRDSTRAIAPLRRHPDAILVDTTGATYEESLDRLETIIKERLPR